MSTRTSLSGLVIVVLGLQISGCVTGTKFIKEKTGIALSKDVAVCTTGPYYNPRCKPDGAGGAAWQRNDNFRFYNIPPRYQSHEDLLAEVRRYYLGSPFYEGDIHTGCKANVTAESIEFVHLSQDIDLAAEISRRSVGELIADLEADAKAKNVDITASIRNKFEHSLREEVNQKVKARFIWFIMRYAGGAKDITRNRALVACNNDLAQRLAEQPGRKKDGAFVTGVAGYIILNNKIDADLTSSRVIANALDAAFEGKVPEGAADLKGRLAVKWKKSVEKTMRVRLRRADLDTVVYPLWIQFDRGNPVIVNIEDKHEPVRPVSPPPGTPQCFPSKPDWVHTSGPGEKGAIEVATCKGLVAGQKYTFKLDYLATNDYRRDSFPARLSLRLCNTSQNVCLDEVSADKEILSKNQEHNYLESATTTIPELNPSEEATTYTLWLTYAEGATLVKQFTAIPQAIVVTEKSADAGR